LGSNVVVVVVVVAAAAAADPVYRIRLVVISYFAENLTQILGLYTYLVGG